MLWLLSTCLGVGPSSSYVPLALEPPTPVRPPAVEVSRAPLQTDAGLHEQVSLDDVDGVLLQPAWIVDRELVRGADGRIRALGLLLDVPGLAGLMVAEDGRWRAEWVPDFADATHWFVGQDGTVHAVASEAERLTWHALDQEGERLVELARKLSANVRVIATDGDRWDVWVDAGDRLPEVGYVTGDTYAPTRTASRTDWNRVLALRIPVRDGRELSATLTLPEGDGPFPTVLEIHGGPWSERWRWRWSGGPQRLADAGVATLRVNPRGSPGFGLDDTRAPFGRGMFEDLLDAMSWAEEQGYADRWAAMGGSYGGWASLRLLTEPRAELACAAAGVTYGNLTTRHDRLGVRGIGSRRWRRAESPDRRVQFASGPALVWSGGRDGPNPQAVGRFVRRMRRSGWEAQWLWFSDVGHHYPPGEDGLWLVDQEHAFLAACLGVDLPPPADRPDLHR